MLDLMLEFKIGVMPGEGAAGIGLFVISGSYSDQSGGCGWVKQYVGRHRVDHKRYRDGFVLRIVKLTVDPSSGLA